MGSCHEDDMVLRRVFSGRCRVLVFLMSFVGLIVVMVLLLRPPPPSVVRTSLPARHRKVSVIMCLPVANRSQYERIGRHLRQALYSVQMEYELIVLSPDDIHPLPPEANGWLQGAAHHIEVLKSQGSCEVSFLSAVTRVHYTVVLLIGAVVHDNLNASLAGLLLPLASEHSELVVGSSNRSMGVYQSVLSLMLAPLTSTVHIPLSSLVFAVSRKALEACAGVSGQDGGSLVAELLAKCHWNHWEMHRVESAMGTQRLSLVQVLSLYWHTHPILCVLCGVGVVIICLICSRIHQYIPTLRHKSSSLTRI